MKAIQIHRFGGPEVLVYEDVPKPGPGDLKPGEVLIRVHAIGINPPDWYLRNGYADLPPEWRPTATFPLILGTDVSGVIEITASDVDQYSVNDEVFGMVRFPSVGESRAYSEYVVASVSDLARKPARIDHIHAAGASMAGLTAWQFLIDLGHNEPNPFQSKLHHPRELDFTSTVVINGAAGGVGHMAVQLAKWKGARVVAIASGGNESLLRNLGADDFVDYTQNRPEDVIRHADLVLDTLGGPTSGRFPAGTQKMRSSVSGFPHFRRPQGARASRSHYLDHSGTLQRNTNGTARGVAGVRSSSSRHR
jgi:NADPH:quinone reductase-like Zn-dependent oxidoreductase